MPTGGGTKNFKEMIRYTDNQIKVIILRDREQKQMPKEKSHTAFMVECLYEEYRKSPLMFTEWEQEFIRSLMEKIFNDPNYIFSEKQMYHLEKLWTK